MSAEYPFYTTPPASTALDIALALIAEELPGFEVDGAFTSIKPETVLPACQAMSMTVVAIDEGDLIQVLARDDGEERGWVGLSLDPVPSSRSLDGNYLVTTRLREVEDGVLAIRVEQDGKLDDIPTLAGQFCLVHWGVSRETEPGWPQPLALCRHDGWHAPFTPETYMTEPGVIEAYLASLNPDSSRKQLSASLFLDVMISEEPRRALKVLRSIVALADEEQLGLVSAGPLENLVIASGLEVLEDLKQLAANDERFRRALQGAWLNRAPKRVRSELAKFGCS